VSFIALVLDYVTYYTILSNYTIEPSIAAAIGYTAGLFFSYVVIKLKIFRKAWLKNYPATEFIFFALSGIFGIFLTMQLVKLYILFFGPSIHLAKIFSVLISFPLIYIFRKNIIFKKSS
jgi:putative flippase GtrA